MYLNCDSIEVGISEYGLAFIIDYDMLKLFFLKVK